MSSDVAMAKIVNDKNKDVKFLTPELDLMYNSRFSMNGLFKMSIKNMSLSSENELMTKCFVPLENFIINKLGVAEDRFCRKNKLTFKFFNMNVSIVDTFKNLVERKISCDKRSGSNINDINQYLTEDSKIKLVLKLGCVWRSSSEPNYYTYGITYECTDMIILNSKNKLSHHITKHEVDPTHGLKITITREKIEKQKIENVYDNNNVVISI
jgi:hypothetical protein